MRYSKLFGKTIRTEPKGEQSINAKLLAKAGFIRREVSGVYNYLPLGLRVLNKIADIVREEMNAIGAQELLLSSLQSKANWQQTGRWDTFDVLFKIKSSTDTEYGLGPTHEEVLVPIVRQFVSSYRDLPLSLYQIQTKFRDELRAKSGILRGREFLMKDLYSFHTDENDFALYYDKVKRAYAKIFKRLRLDAIETQASGGAFSDISHEYQVITPHGEDEIIYCPGGDFSANTEVSPVKEGKECELGHGPLKRAKTIEVGNIFPLKTKFSDAFGLTYKNKDGKEMPVIMGCYGIGISRVMGAIVEVMHDEKGIMWPQSVSPFDAHLVHVEDLGTEPIVQNVYKKLTNAGIDVLWDDRADVSAGEKFADADLIGIPIRLVISAKTHSASSGQAGNMVEWKERSQSVSQLISVEDAIKQLKR